MASAQGQQSFAPDFQANKPQALWWNGEIVPWNQATVHVADMAWAGVTAVFEGIMSYWNEEQGELYIWQLDAHLRRLLQSQRLIRQQSPYSVAELKDAAIALAKHIGATRDSYIFPYSFPKGGGGFDSSTKPEPEPVDMFITVRPNPSHLGKGWAQTACISSFTRISDNVMPPRIKNIANYRNSNLAMAESKANGYDTALIMNTQGKVAEGPGSCVVLVRDGKLITPATTDSILESISRYSVLELAKRELGLEVIERPVDRTELYLADEIFMVGTAAEILAIRKVDSYVVGDGVVGPITTQLDSIFEDVVRGKRPEYADWLTPVGFAK